MEKLAPHRGWLSLLAGGLFLIFAGVPLSDLAMDAARKRAAVIAKQQANTESAIVRFHDDMQLLQQPGNTMAAEDIERMLAPVDRLQVVVGMERQAASALFTHFTYALSPEKKVKMDDAETSPLAESLITVSADMPLDSDAASFMRGLGYALPGRVHLRHLLLSRWASDAPLSLANIHMEAELIWLSNGAP